LELGDSGFLIRVKDFKPNEIEKAVETIILAQKKLHSKSKLRSPLETGLVEG